MRNTFFALLMCSSIFSGCSCQKVEPGTVGLMVELSGSNKGLEPQELGPGYHYVGPMEQFYDFPIFEQTYVWSKSLGEGRPQDESFTFQTKEGLPVNTDIGINFHIEAGKVSQVFTKFRRDIDYLKHTYMHNVVRDQLNQVASRMSVESVYGEGKADLIKAVEDGVRREVAPNGIVVTNIFISGEFRLPDQIKAQIQSKIQATQKAMQIENELAQSVAEAKKTVATAEGAAKTKVAIANGDATAAVAQAQGEATATLAKAQAQAKANELLARSVTPQLLELKRLDIQMQAASNWKGDVPTVQTGAGGGTLLNMQLPAIIGK